MDFEKKKESILVVLCLCLTSCYQVNGTLIIYKEEDLELGRQLKLINKLPLKSIQVLRYFRLMFIIIYMLQYCNVFYESKMNVTRKNYQTYRYKHSI